MNIIPMLTSYLLVCAIIFLIMDVVCNIERRSFWQFINYLPFAPFYALYAIGHAMFRDRSLDGLIAEANKALDELDELEKKYYPERFKEDK